MSVKTAVSVNLAPEACARELRAQIGDFNSTFVLFFASPAVDPESLCAALAKQFGQIPSLGCTSAGEITTGRLLEHSVVLMAMDADTVETAKIEVIRDVNDEGSVGEALRALSNALGTAPSALDPSRVVGLVVHDGTSGGEEAVMSALATLTNVPFVGGTAGDDCKFERTWTFANFRAHSGKSTLALLKTRLGFDVLKTQSFSVLDKQLVATEVDEQKRIVKRFNGRPAADEYVAQLGISREEAPKYIRRHPIAIMMNDGEPFVRGLQRIQGDGIALFCHVKQGAILHLMQAEDIVAQTRRDLQQALKRLESCAGIVNFNCIERTIELKDRGQVEDYAAIFKDVPTVGFSTYGESYIGHLNQTATMVLFR